MAPCVSVYSEKSSAGDSLASKIASSRKSKCRKEKAL